MKNWLKILLILLILAALLYGIWALSMDPYRGTVQEWEPSEPLDSMMSKEEAAEDLEQAIRLLRSRHAGWKLNDPNAVETEQAMDDAIAALPEELSVLELWQTIAKCLHHLKDAHTMAVYIPEHELYLSDWTPFERYGLPVAINGVDAEQYYSTIHRAFSYETEAYARQKILGEMPLSEHWMRFLGVDTKDDVAMTFATSEGEQTFVFSYVFPELVKGSDKKPWVSWEIHPELDAAVFTLRSCVVNKEYESALSEFFAEIEKQEIGNVIVDLRGNGGGNSYVANLFLQYLDVETYQAWDSDVRFGWYLHRNRNIVIENERKPNAFSGKVYVLTDVETFSAGKDFAMLLADNDFAVHVGQAPGNLPDAYMDILQFRLSNSGLKLSMTYKRAYRLDRAQSGCPLEPDYVTEDAIKTVYELIEKAPQS